MNYEEIKLTKKNKLRKTMEEMNELSIDKQVFTMNKISYEFSLI